MTDSHQGDGQAVTETFPQLDWAGKGARDLVGPVLRLDPHIFPKCLFSDQNHATKY